VNARDAWNVAYSQLELQFDRASFDTWLRHAILLDVEAENRFVIGVRNAYARDMLQHRLYRNIHRVVSDACGHDVELHFEVYAPPEQEGEQDEMPLFRLLAQQDVSNDQQRPLHEAVSRPQRPDLPESELNARYQFDRFIVSKSNRIAYEAARAIAEAPGRSYNPFMVYGGVGLGKTHLLQAIGHICQDRGLRVIYIPSEVFTNDLVMAIRSKTTAMFREKYRSADVLLMDDVQFIAGKESTQEEFFHTFNALVTFNKQIVIASDRHPSELTLLEDRLRSRFEGGLVTDIQPLEFESRLALVESWAYERGVNLDYPVLEMIATRGHSNVRELEGVFNQIVAKVQLGSGRLTVESAESTLSRFDRPRHHSRRQVSVEDIIAVTSEMFNLDGDDIVGKRRTARINHARQITMYLIRELTELSLPQIGQLLGGRSHTTVLHGANKIVEEIEFDSALRAQIEEIREALDAS